MNIIVPQWTSATSHLFTIFYHEQPFDYSRIHSIRPKLSDLILEGFYILTPVLINLHSSSCLSTSAQLIYLLFLDCTWTLVIRCFSSFCLPCKNCSYFILSSHLAYLLTLSVAPLKSYFLLCGLLKSHVTFLPMHSCVFFVYTAHPAC